MEDIARECDSSSRRSAVRLPEANYLYREEGASTLRPQSCSSRYRGAPDPLRGEAPSQEVRTEADVCLKAIFGNDSAAQQNPCVKITSKLRQNTEKYVKNEKNHVKQYAERIPFSRSPG